MTTTANYVGKVAADAHATAPLDFDLFYGGDSRTSGGERRMTISNPATGAVIGSVPDATEADVRAATRAAQDAVDRGDWTEADALDRGRILNQLADALADRISYYASLESAVTGRPIREMQAQMARLPEWFRYFAGIARGLEGGVAPFKGAYLSYTQHQPYGVVALITPWNHPLLIMVKKLSAALAAGNCVVVKPSDLAPISALDFAAMATEAGLPAGVLNVVTGTGEGAGAALCRAPEVARIDLTGGTETGRRVGAIAADRIVPVTLELGGKAPVLIFDGTPLEEAVNAAAFAAFVATGQTCISGTRFLVAAPLYDDFVAAFAAKARSIRLGHPADPETDMGPLIARRQTKRVLDYIDIGLQDGARLVAGGGQPDVSPPLSNENFVEPTVFADVTPEMRIFQEEIFGPVACVTPFADEAAAIRLANATSFGLGASVWTRDVGQAHRVAKALKSGIVWINDHHKNDPAAVWGGFGASGHGKENGWQALQDYLRTQSVVVRLSEEFPDWYGASGPRRYG